MKYNNKSVQLLRERSDARRVYPLQSVPYQCSSTFPALKQCLGTHTLAIHLDKSTCDTTEWKQKCTGIHRRYFIQQTYRQQVNTIMYTQQELDNYASAKNYIKGIGFLQ